MSKNARNASSFAAAAAAIPAVKAASRPHFEGAKSDIIAHAKARAETGAGYANLFLVLAKTAREYKMSADEFQGECDALIEQIKTVNGSDYITASQHRSNAKRIVAAPQDAYDAAVKKTGGNNIKLLAAELPKLATTGRKAAEKDDGTDNALPTAAPAAPAAPLSIMDQLRQISAAIAALQGQTGVPDAVAAELADAADSMMSAELAMKKAAKKAA